MNLEQAEATIKIVKEGIASSPELSSELRSGIESLVELVSELLSRMQLNSQNSSKPPSSDPNQDKKRRRTSGRKPGGQPDHTGTTLKQRPNPDKIVTLKVSAKDLPQPRGVYHEVEPEIRQVIDIVVKPEVTEYRAQVLEDAQGRRFTASFPAGMTQAIQYGQKLKAHAVYLSQYQLLPYQRLSEYFADQLNLPISPGTLHRYNREAHERLTTYEQRSKQQLRQAKVNHADETGINIQGERRWLHSLSNPQWTHYFPHKKRGRIAMDEADILPQFQGILCHDHWKPYYQYTVLHALCNAHHLRELTRVEEQDHMAWATQMKQWLLDTKRAVEQTEGKALTGEALTTCRASYQALLKQAEIACPPPEPPPGKRKRGRLKRSRARNLLERLITYQDDVLRFMVDPLVPFTNNLGERDIRMTKVQQKISGCFRSELGAQIFCRIRGYLSTCRKQLISASEALNSLFDGKLPQLDWQAPDTTTV